MGVQRLCDVVGEARLVTCRKQHGGRVLWRTSASDALAAASHPDLFPVVSDEVNQPRLLFFSTARVPFSFGE